MNYTKKSFNVTMGSVSKEFADRWALAFPKERFHCGTCAQEFDSTEAVLEHRKLEHPKMLAEPLRTV